MNDKNDVLMKNNVLIKARYDINTYENKLFILLLYKLQKINETTCKCELKVSEIKQILNARTVRNKKEIATLLSELRMRAIYFKKDDKWGEYGFINGYQYDPENDSFEIEASEKVYGLLREYLENGYTPINMNIWLGLKSSYAQRFYDLLRLWSNTKTTIEYSIEELRELLMLEKKYPEYRDFKRRVVNPAVKELNATGFFEIDVSEKKSGRKVEAIDFIVKDLDKRTYFDKKADNLFTAKIDMPEEVESEKETDADKEVHNKNTKDFYVPNKKLFTAKTLKDFMTDFNEYDFSDKKLKQILQESIVITLDQDDEEKIKVKSYNYFKGVLINKLKKYSKTVSDKNEFSQPLKTRFHNHRQTFTKYTPEELEEILFESQKDKFK